MKNLSYTKLFTLIVFIIFVHQKMNAQYPCIGCIYGNIGEERHTVNINDPSKSEPPRSRYHYGVDFGQTNGKDVVAIETGPLRWDQGKGKFAIGTYGYVHVIPNEIITKNENGFIINQGEVIGIITAGHLHLQRASTQIYSSPNNTGDIRSIESTNNIDWINYISDVGRSGAATPVIHDAILYRQPTKLGVDITTNPIKLNDIPKLYGKYDILLNSTEKTSLGTLAPYKMEFKINDNSGNILKDWSGMEFKKVPLKISAKKVMGLKSNHKNKAFEYVITNNPFQDPFDRFLNFRKHELFDQTTNWPLKAKYKDGTKIRLWVRSCNELNACDTEMIIPGSTGIYELDNFQPYIVDVKVMYSNIDMYRLKRNEASLSTENSGFLINKILKKSFIPSAGAEIELTVSTSEILSELKIGYNLNNEDEPTNYYNMTQSFGNKLEWTYKFRPANVNNDDYYYFTFKGSDISSNKLVDVFWASLRNGGMPVPIPCRINHTGTEWVNLPAIQPGKDHVKVPFNTCALRFYDEDNCNILESAETHVAYLSCKDATIRLSSPGFVPTNYTITWSDIKGNILQ